MATTVQQHMDERDRAAALGCLDVLAGASALLARHKAEVKGLLPMRGSSGRGALERLMADLGEVLGTARGGTGEEQQQQGEESGGSSRSSSPVPGSGAKRAKGQQQQQQQQQQQAVQAGQVQQQQEQQYYSQQQHSHHQRQQQQQQQQQVPSCFSVNRDPLSIEEVLERVMSFAEGRELLGRLSRVCRLWRRVSEREELCWPVLRRVMTSAFVDGEESLHARLGGSARRCLAAYDAWQRPGRMMCGEAKLNDLRYLADVSFDGKLLVSQSGWIVTYEDDEEEPILRLTTEASVSNAVQECFSAASLDVPDLHAVFTSKRLHVRYCVMDPATGVTACIFNGPFEHHGDLPTAEYEDADDNAASLVYEHGPMPMTSRTYGGPQLLGGELCLTITPKDPQDEDLQHLASMHQDREREWWFQHYVNWVFTGQPGVYVEQFIRSRLAKEAEAMAAKNKHGGRW